ncbi:MAG: cellulase family glycosylhydrolase [Spirochaetales bacterium]|nr:cellulase family glycosylhydrolase [Spirochaetales bacterium]
MRKFLLFFIPVITLILTCSLGNGSGGGEEWPEYPGEAGGYTQFIQVDEDEPTLLEAPDGLTFLIKGIAFGNHVWGNPSTHESFTHHGPKDYARVKSMGFNSIRFYINYGLFESDGNPYAYKQDGFTWLDMNIAAARVNGIYLILNMHYPQGGFQSNGDGDALWTEQNNQLRLIALWKEIAERYKDEEIIIGYGLVNEPVPLNGVAQWTGLAQNIINAIRDVDPYHLIFAERAIWVKGGDNQIDRDNFYFPIGLTDPGPKNNIVYEYHMYEPFEFTHQNASWVPSLLGIYSEYPDPNRIIAQDEQWTWFTDNNPTAPSGTFAWTALAGNSYQVNNADYRLGRPVIQTHTIGANGTVYIDDIVVEEYDENGVFLRTIMDSPVDDANGWYFWTADGNGSGSLATGVSGASGGACLKITGTTGDSNFGHSLRFLITQNYRYKISGRVRGNNVAAGATVRFRVDFYNCTGDILTWGKDYLQARIGSYMQWSADKGAPLYLGEFGTIVYGFQNNRGGLVWVSDMLDILKTGNVNYNYHDYHETSFGIYLNPDWELPDPESANTPLIQLFKTLQK